MDKFTWTLQILGYSCKHNAKGHFTLELEGPTPLTHDIQMKWLGREAQDGPSSFYTRPWRSKGPDKIEWMKNPHDILHAWSG